MDSEEPSQLLCVRVSVAKSTSVVHGSIQSKCDTCGEVVWISPSGQRNVESGCVPICDNCVNMDEVEVKVTDASIKELFNHFLDKADKEGVRPKPFFDMLGVMFTFKNGS